MEINDGHHEKTKLCPILEIWGKIYTEKFTKHLLSWKPSEVAKIDHDYNVQRAMKNMVELGIVVNQERWKWWINKESKEISVSFKWMPTDFDLSEIVYL